jgi:hypothetical protein
VIRFRTQSIITTIIIRKRITIVVAVSEKSLFYRKHVASGLNISCVSHMLINKERETQEMYTSSSGRSGSMVYFFVIMKPLLRNLFSGKVNASHVHNLFLKLLIILETMPTSSEWSSLQVSKPNFCEHFSFSHAQYTSRPLSLFYFIILVTSGGKYNSRACY